MDWARENGLEIIGVSAKTGNHVQDVFEELTRKLMKIHPKKESEVMRLGLQEARWVKK